MARPPLHPSMVDLNHYNDPARYRLKLKTFFRREEGSERERGGGDRVLSDAPPRPFRTSNHVPLPVGVINDPLLSSRAPSCTTFFFRRESLDSYRANLSLPMIIERYARLLFCHDSTTFVLSTLLSTLHLS